MVRRALALAALGGLSACGSVSTPPREASTRAAEPSALVDSPPPPEKAPVAGRVAITVDDLGVSRESSEPDVSRKILGSLAAAQAPVAVFANCKALDPSTLSLWQHAGATIGNHTQTHLSLEDIDAANETAREAWQRDVKSCDDALFEVLGERVRFFRYPYLRYGADEAQRGFADAYLRSLGYRVAHVTAATSEWLLAQYYDAALAAGDRALVEELAQAYVDHMLETLAEARRWTRAKTGRDAAQITLLHVNALARDHLGSVLRALAAAGWQFIALEEALADPLYARADDYVGHCGCSWLARIAPPLTPSDDYFFGDAETAISQRFGSRVEDR